MRILLKDAVSGFYLQPSGEWSKERETARDFGSAVVAYWWATEQGLKTAEVLLAGSDPKQDLVAIRVHMGPTRPVINCRDPNWWESLHAHLFRGQEVDLVNFDYGLHGRSCEILAKAFEMEFQLDRSPKTATAQFRSRAKVTKSRAGRQEATSLGIVGQAAATPLSPVGASSSR